MMSGGGAWPGLLRGKRLPWAARGNLIGQAQAMVPRSGLAENCETGLAQLRLPERPRPDDAATLEAQTSPAELDANQLSLVQGLSSHYSEAAIRKVKNGAGRFSGAFRGNVPHGDGQGLRDPGGTTR